MAEKTTCINQPQQTPIKIIKWKVSENTTILVGRVILLYELDGQKNSEQRKLKLQQTGTICRIVAKEGAVVAPGEILCELKACNHPTIMNDMCADCGADLRKDDLATTASVPMVHAIPDLKVSEELAQKLGKADCECLLKDRKLVLLVDLDQTLIHTTNDNIPANIKDVYHFQLYGPQSPWYHTRLRPGTHNFLNNISKYFELHICTFGARNYAHTIAAFLDKEQKYFSNRILSRDECFDPTSKKANLKGVKWNAGNKFEVALKKRIEMDEIRKQIEVLSTFLPDQILNLAKDEKTNLSNVQSWVGVLLFADVSGFTPLTEKFAKTGKSGIYRLTATLNAFIGGLVEIINFFGGDVLKFSGDAFLAVWKVEPNLFLYKVIHEVVVCALFIQANLGQFNTEVNVVLGVKLAIACGNLTFSVIGDENFRHYLILGDAINDVKAAEHDSVKGQVVMAPSAWGHLAEDFYEVVILEQGNIKVSRCVYKFQQEKQKEIDDQKCTEAQILCNKHIEHRNNLYSKKNVDTETDSDTNEKFIKSLPPRQSVKNAPRYWIINQINPFIISTVQNQVLEKQPIEYLTEMREVTIQFINIVPASYTELKLLQMVNSSYKIVCNIVTELRGIVNKVSLFDKDAMMLVLFGLRGSEHELESRNALKSAYKIRKIVDRLENVNTVSIGITKGYVYCGVVGHPLRREYTVIGGAVNKAARIMCAYPKKVTCDHETYKNSKLSSFCFQLQSQVNLKGIQDAGHIFEYNEKYDENQKMYTSKTQQLNEGEWKTIVNRKTELYLIEALLQHKSSTFFGLCFNGPLKIGKTKLLKYGLHLIMHLKKHYNMAVVNLISSNRRPYFVISAIYQQLYNNLAKRNSEVINNLPPDLWDLNKIVRTKLKKNDAITKKHEILTMFQNICDETTAIFIDNVEYIDTKSWEVLMITLKLGKLILLCAGNIKDEEKYKFLINKYITFYDLKTIRGDLIATFICHYLNVEGVNEEMVHLIRETSEGKPGWIQSSLAMLNNNTEIEIKFTSINDNNYIFIDSSDVISLEKNFSNGERLSKIVSVVEFSNKYYERAKTLTAAEITMDLFDSFTIYQQIIIKTAAILGEIFTRNILLVLLKYPNEKMFSNAIKELFDEDVFGCGSKYIITSGSLDVSNGCQCFIADHEYDKSLPRYASCKLLFFKSKNLLLTAYNILPQNRKKEIHLRITDLLETQNNLCPYCLRNDTASIIQIELFKDFMELCDETLGDNLNDNRKPDEELIEAKCTIGTFKNIIREEICRDHKNVDTLLKIPKRRLWDPSICFCIEILLKIYSDLIHHSECAGHLPKQIFYMFQYSKLFLLTNDLIEPIPLLNKASEFCMIDNNNLQCNFKLLMTGRIHMLLSEIYFRLGNLPYAKNHIMITLRQYRVPLISFKYTLPHIIMTRHSLTEHRQYLFPKKFSKLKNLLIKTDFGLCMSLVSNIFAKEGHWQLAKLAAQRSLSCLKRCNTNIVILSDVYSNLIDVYSYCGDLHFCEKLERCLNKQIIFSYSNNSLFELMMINKLLSVIFELNVLNCNLNNSIKLGYRIFEVNLVMQAYYLQNDFLPLFTTTLLFLNKIAEAVYLAQILYNIGKKYYDQGFVAYYAFALELLLETNFQMEPIERIEMFLKRHFSSRKRRIETSIEKKFIVYFHAYALKYPGRTQIKDYSINFDIPKSALSTLTIMKHLECILLQMVLNKKSHTNLVSTEIADITIYLEESKIWAERWLVFKPRYLQHCAYFYRVTNHTKKSRKYLSQSYEIAQNHGNLLEQALVLCHFHYWFEKVSVGIDDREHLYWKLADNYQTVNQWSEIMCPFPVY